MDRQRIAGRVVARDGYALRDRRRTVTGLRVAEADVLLLERDGQDTLDVDVHARTSGRGLAGRWAARTRRGSDGGVARRRGCAREVARVRVRIRAAVVGPKSRGRVVEAGRSAGALEVARGSVADQVSNVGVCGATPGRRPTGQGGRASHERDLASGIGKVRRACRIGRRKRSADCGRRGELDEEELARLDRAAERRDLPARAGRGCVLDRPTADVDRRSAAVEQLDEVVRIGRAAVAAARVHLADDHVGGSTLRRGHDQQRTGEEEGKNESSSMHGLLRSEEGHDHPSGTGPPRG